jgi:radical SAM protein with 4Fe4S-binding SPASM domain
MAFEDWQKVLDEGFNAGCRRIQFTGGECTLYPHLLKLIDYARRSGYEKIDIFTNGTLLDEDFLKTLRGYGVRLAFSVYSFRPEIHDEITKHNGSHQKTIESIKRAINLEIPIRVGIVQMEENSDDIDETKSLLRSIGVKRIHSDHMRGVGRGATARIINDPLQELCSYCWRGQLAIDPNGNIYPCVFSRFYKVGHVSEGLSSIVNKRNLQTFRKNVYEIHQERGEDCRSNKCGNCDPDAGDFSPASRESLRTWWHKILRRYGKYPCYGAFLLLPADSELTSYLKDLGKELNILAEKYCLILDFNQAAFKYLGFLTWAEAVDEYVSKGYSIKVADYFNVKYQEFPCLILFEDIRSSKHIVISFKDMGIGEITKYLRTVFTIIRTSSINKQNPLEALESNRNAETLKKAGKSIVSELRKFTDKTIETAIEVWIKSSTE